MIHLPIVLALLMVHKRWNLPGYSHTKEEEEEVEEIIQWVTDDE